MALFPLPKRLSQHAVYEAERTDARPQTIIKEYRNRWSESISLPWECNTYLVYNYRLTLFLCTLKVAFTSVLP